MNADVLLKHYERIADAPDAISRLRKFVLDLAIRGKLVAQDLKDESARELLDQIKAKKEHLVSLGELKKAKQLPPLTKDEWPFELPESWLWTRMRQVTSDRGQKIPEQRFTYIDVTAINKEAGIVADPKVMEAEEAPSRARKITKKGDVIYSCVRPYLLNVAIIESDFDPAPIASTAFAILNGHGLVLPRYLWIVLRSPFMVTCVEINQRGQAYPAINDADFSLLPFPFPQPPDDLKRRVGFAGAGRHDQQNTVLPLGDGFHRRIDRVDLVIARLFAATVIVIVLQNKLLRLGC